MDNVPEIVSYSALTDQKSQVHATSKVYLKRTIIKLGYYYY